MFVWFFTVSPINTKVVFTVVTRKRPMLTMATCSVALGHSQLLNTPPHPTPLHTAAIRSHELMLHTYSVPVWPAVLNVRLEALDRVSVFVALHRLEGDLQRQSAQVGRRLGRRHVQMHVEDAAEGPLLRLQPTTGQTQG